MRKQYKKKERSCPICKPNKVGWENRWNRKDRDIIEDSEKQIQKALRGEDLEEDEDD